MDKFAEFRGWHFEHMPAAMRAKWDSMVQEEAAKEFQAELEEEGFSSMVEAMSDCSTADIRHCMFGEEEEAHDCNVQSSSVSAPIDDVFSHCVAAAVHNMRWAAMWEICQERRKQGKD